MTPASASSAAWQGSAYRLIPHGKDPLFFEHAGRNRDSRWNYPGTPTLYLAEDVHIAWNEYTRHARDRTSAGLPLRLKMRDMYRFDLYLQYGVEDLREPAVSSRYGIADMWDARHYRSFDVTRTIAEQVRRFTPAQGVLVPPLGFLDQRVGWNLVVFLDKVPDIIEQCIHATAFVHAFDMSQGRA